MESKFGLVNVWLQGDWVTRSVALLLLGMSLASWIVIVVKAIDLFRYRRLAGGAAPFWHSAPFVGLFGTVWGVYHALVAIGMSGAGTLDKVAGPVGEALIMTALGLAVAIPAVLGYNALVRGNKHILARLNRFAHDLHAYLVTGARVHSGNGGDGKVVPMKKA